MILTIAGVFNEFGGRDLSMYLDRQAQFRVDSMMGNQIDTCEFTLFDKAAILGVPDRAEIIVYDAEADPQLSVFPDVVDSPTPNSTPLGYQWGIFDWDTTALYDTAPPLSDVNNPTNWTGRIFAGYIASTDYSLTSGQERVLEITCQDYTIRNKTTICNRAYGPDSEHIDGWSDSEIIRDLYLTYRPDIDVTFVQTIVPEGQMTPISFPFHTLEQMMQRVTKISGGYYRIDYYRRLWYGPLGTQVAPLQISDTPDEDEGPFSVPPAFGAEAIHYGRDATASVDRIWVIGGTYLGPQTPYTVTQSADGHQYVWNLPARLQAYRKSTSSNPANMTVTVGGVEMSGDFGTLGIDGTLDNQETFGAEVLISSKAPYVIAFRTTPGVGQSIVLTSSFLYTLVQVVSNPESIANLSGLIVEKVVRDNRITSAQEAVEVGNAHLNLYGRGKAMGSMTVYQRGVGGNLLQPGQLIRITNKALFALNTADPTDPTSIIPTGGATLTAVILQMTTTLIPGSPKYSIDVSFSDQVQLDDDTLFSQLIGEQNRVNAAIAEGDVNDLTQDFQFLTEEPAAEDVIVVVPLGGEGFEWQ